MFVHASSPLSEIGTHPYISKQIAKAHGDKEMGMNIPDGI